MTVKIEAITETCDEVTGITNTMGETEIYRVISHDRTNFTVLVQRKNGKFAALNRNVHQVTFDRVVREWKKAK